MEVFGDYFQALKKFLYCETSFRRILVAFKRELQNFFGKKDKQ